MQGHWRQECLLEKKKWIELSRVIFFADGLFEQVYRALNMRSRNFYSMLCKLFEKIISTAEIDKFDSTANWTA